MDAAVPEGTLLRTVFRLEGERTVALAKLVGGVAGADTAIASVDAQLGAALSALEARGVRYPGHAIAERHGFSDADYVVLQLALLDRREDTAVRIATEALGAGADVVRLSHAARLVWPRGEAGAEDAVRDLIVVREGYVRLVDDRRTDADADDPLLVVGQATRELMGLG